MQQFLNDWVKSFNKRQKQFLVFFVPILTFLAVFPIAEIASGHYEFGITHLDLQNTWYIWLIYLMGTGFMEIKILGKFEN